MNRKGFTLIELMIVIVIVGILVAVAIPKFTEASRREQARQYFSGRGFPSSKVESAIDNVCKVHSPTIGISEEEFNMYVLNELKGIKPTPKVKKSNNAVTSTPKPNGAIVTVTEEAMSDGVTVAGEFVLFGKDVDVYTVLETLKENQEENGYKYIDEITHEHDSPTIKVKLRKY